MDLHERERVRKEIADFRYSVIAELCNPYLSEEEKNILLKEKVQRQYDIPGSTKTRITSETVRNWIRKYTQYGKEGLLPKRREDRGKPRSFTDTEAESIIRMLEKKPELTVSSVIKKLKNEGIIESEISSSALSRFVRANNLTRKQRIKVKDDKIQLRFSFESPLQCVQADAMHGFPFQMVKVKRERQYFSLLLMMQPAVSSMAALPSVKNHFSLKMEYVIFSKVMAELDCFMLITDQLLSQIKQNGFYKPYPSTLFTQNPTGLKEEAR